MLDCLSIFDGAFSVVNENKSVQMWATSIFKKAQINAIKIVHGEMRGNDTRVSTPTLPKNILSVVCLYDVIRTV